MLFRSDAALLALKARLSTVGPRQYLVLTNRVEPRPEVTRNPTDYAGRGVLLEIGIHQLDLIRFLTGEEVAEVRCEMDRSSAGSPESRALVSLRTTGHLPCLVDVSRVTSGRVSRAEWVGADGQMIADWVRHQVSMTVKARVPATIGNHPPSASFSRLAPKKAKSTIAKTRNSGSSFHSGHLAPKYR